MAQYIILLLHWWAILFVNSSVSGSCTDCYWDASWEMMHVWNRLSVKHSSGGYPFLWVPYQFLRFLLLLFLIQVQEKKVKKLSDMTIDPPRAVGNGSVASSSVSSSPKQCLANGSNADRSFNCLSNDLSFPPGGISSLRLPVVVVLKLYMSCMFDCFWNVNYGCALRF